MRLSKEEYCMFNLASRIKIVESDGIFLVKRVLNNTYEIKLFRLYDFYVELYCNYRVNKILKADPLKGKQWLSKFYMDLINGFNFC